MNEPILSKLSYEIQRDRQREAADFRLIKEACAHQPGIFNRLRCAVLLGLGHFLVKLGQRLESLAPVSNVLIENPPREVPG